MIKTAMLMAGVLLAISARSGLAAAPSPDIRAFGEEITQCIGDKVQLRAAVLTLQARVDALSSELAAAKKATDPKAAASKK